MQMQGLSSQNALVRLKTLPRLVSSIVDRTRAGQRSGGLFSGVAYRAELTVARLLQPHCAAERAANVQNQLGNFASEMRKLKAELPRKA